MNVADPRSLRVLHVSHTASAGGAELALVRLLSDGPRPGQRQRLLDPASGNPAWTASVCAPSAGTVFDALEDRGIPVLRQLPTLPTGGTRTNSPLLAARYLAALGAGAHALRRGRRVNDADLVHANTAAAAIMCGLGGRRAVTPLVVHLRDLVTPGSLGRFGLVAFTRIALARADGVIANSRYTLESARRWLDAAVPTAVIHSPIGISRRIAQPAVRPAVKVIGMIGRLQRWKGQHVFLRAFAHAFRGGQVRARLAGAPLFGADTYADELRRLAAELGIAEQVSFLGQVADPASFFASVDLAVHASTRPEPLGQTVLQALAYGTPVIATAGGGPSEWITDGVNGLLVEPDQPAALAAAMTALASSYELRARLAGNGALTENILTDRECAAAHAEFFHEVVRRHAARTADTAGRLGGDPGD